jgi:hypothetical protein
MKLRSCSGQKCSLVCRDVFSTEISVANWPWIVGDRGLLVKNKVIVGEMCQCFLHR